MSGEVDFLAHEEGDTVAVAVRDVLRGDGHLGFLSSSSMVQIVVLENIPLGHKVALADIAKDEAVREYGEAIGVAKKDISVGELVHVHNIRSTKWQVGA